MGPHGEHSIDVDGRVLVCRVLEAWNVEQARRFVADIQQAVAALGKGSWCRVVNMLDYQLHTPEVVEEMAAFGRWATANGCLCHAFVIANDLQQGQLQRAYGERLPPHLFADEAEAISFCHRQLRAHRSNYSNA